MTVENSVALLDYPYERAHWRSIARTFDKPFLYVVTPQFEQQAVNLKRTGQRHKSKFSKKPVMRSSPTSPSGLMP